MAKLIYHHLISVIETRVLTVLYNSIFAIRPNMKGQTTLRTLITIEDVYSNSVETTGMVIVPY